MYILNTYLYNRIFLPLKRKEENQSNNIHLSVCLCVYPPTYVSSIFLLGVVSRPCEEMYSGDNPTAYWGVSRLFSTALIFLGTPAAQWTPPSWALGLYENQSSSPNDQSSFDAVSQSPFIARGYLPVHLAHVLSQVPPFPPAPLWKAQYNAFHVLRFLQNTGRGEDFCLQLLKNSPGKKILRALLCAWNWRIQIFREQNTT